MVIRNRRLIRSSTLMLLLVSCVLFVNDAFSQSPPPLREQVPVVDDHLVKEPTAGVRIGKLRVLFDSTKMADIGVELHNVITTHERTPYGGFTWLCFTVVEARASSRVWVESDDEMGGSDQVVTGIYTASLSENVKPTSQCPALPGGGGTVTFDSDLKLGSSIEDLRRALGSAPSTNQGWWRYLNDDSGSAHANLGELDVKLQNGIVVAVQAARLETY